MPLKDLLQGVAMGSRDDDTVLSLANRLVRLNKQLDDKAKARIEKLSGGIPVGELGKSLDHRAGPGRHRPGRSRRRPGPGHHPRRRHVAPARIRSRPRQPRGRRLRALRQARVARRDRKRPAASASSSSTTSTSIQVTFSGFSEQAEAQAQAVIQTFADYIHQHKDEIAALGFFYQQPYQRRALTFEMIEELHERLSRAAADAHHRGACGTPMPACTRVG